mgnify:CR=1 FL=1|jgi:probable phosphoglycerate mutase
MTTLYITRHGETIWNTEKRMQGHRDSDLSPLGLQQAGWIADRLRDVSFDAAYSSPCNRAWQTALAICNTHNILPVKDQGLIEIGLGLWEGCQIDDVARNYPEQSRNFWAKPSAYQPTEGGEHFQQVYHRVTRCVKHIVQKHPEQSVLLVSHAVVLKTLLSFLENIPMDEYWTSRPFLTQGSLTVAESEQGKFRLVLFNDASHHGWIRQRDLNTW